MFTQTYFFVAFFSCHSFWFPSGQMGAVGWLSLSLMSFGMVLSLCGANLVDATYNLDKLLGLFLEPSALAASVSMGAVLWAMRAALARFFQVGTAMFVLYLYCRGEYLHT
jgi:hypothetical protein